MLSCHTSAMLSHRSVMMEKAVVIGFYVLVVLLKLTDGTGTLMKRFEYKHSFKGPHLVQKDRSVPFWSYIGNAIASDDFIRVAPSLKSQRGLVWNKRATDFENWEVEMTFKISGRGRVGADGLAFWYINDDKAMTGPVFGGGDQWKGLGIFFDSFDNDAQNNNPYISAVLNDGTKKYDHHSDGISQQLGGCMRDYRNKPYPVKARIRYENRVLMVYTSNSGVRPRRPKMVENEEEPERFDVCIYIKNIDLPVGGHFMLSAATGAIAGTSAVLCQAISCSMLFINSGQSSSYDESLYEMCLRAEGVEMQPAGHFMVSAATGALADDHDVLSFITHSLRSENEMKAQAVKDEERIKYENEYQEYEKKLDEARNDYKKEHPDDTEKKLNIEKDGYFEGEARELRMIFEAQDQMHFEIKGINKRMNELLGMQERVVSQLANVQAGGSIQAPGGAPASGGAPVIQRHEIDTLMRQTNDVIASLGSLRQSVDDVSRQRRSADSGNLGYATQNHEVKDRMDELAKDMKTLIQRERSNTNQAGQISCPEVRCVSSMYFGGFIVAQIVIFLVVGYMRSKSDQAAKKFY